MWRFLCRKQPALLNARAVRPKLHETQFELGMPTAGRSSTATCTQDAFHRICRGRMVTLNNQLFSQRNGYQRTRALLSCLTFKACCKSCRAKVFPQCVLKDTVTPNKLFILFEVMFARPSIPMLAFLCQGHGYRHV